MTSPRDSCYTDAPRNNAMSSSSFYPIAGEPKRPVYLSKAILVPCQKSIAEAKKHCASAHTNQIYTALHQTAGRLTGES